MVISLTKKTSENRNWRQESQLTVFGISIDEVGFWLTVRPKVAWLFYFCLIAILKRKHKAEIYAISTCMACISLSIFLLAPLSAAFCAPNSATRSLVSCNSLSAALRDRSEVSTCERSSSISAVNTEMRRSRAADCSRACLYERKNIY